MLRFHVVTDFLIFFCPQCVVKGKEWNWTAWDCINVDLGRDVTLGEFMDYFKTEYNLEISMLSQGVSIIYSFFANKQKIKERMKMPMSQVVQTVGMFRLVCFDDH